MGPGQGLCGENYSIWVAALTVFLLLMLDNVPHLVHLITTACFSRELRYRGKHQVLSISNGQRIVAALLAVATEVVAWVIMMDTGIRFVLTASTVVELCRSTVALMFIMQVDEFIYKSCSTPALRRRIADKQFRVNYAALLNYTVPERKLYASKNVYSLYVHMPLLLLISFVGVLILRNTNPTCGFVDFNFW